MNPKLPFKYCYWAVPGKILAGCCPGTIDPSMAHEQLTELVDAGVTLVVNLMEASELELFQTFFETYETTLSAIAEAKGRTIRIERFPIPDRSIPASEQMTSILKAVDARGSGLRSLHGWHRTHGHRHRLLFGRTGSFESFGDAPSSHRFGI